MQKMLSRGRRKKWLKENKMRKKSGWIRIRADKEIEKFNPLKKEIESPRMDIIKGKLPQVKNTVINALNI